MQVVDKITLEPAVKSLVELAQIVQKLKEMGEVVVLCHGVFDLLHIGHIRHLREARMMGHRLIVTLTPDRYVNKGPHRPAFNEQQRAEAIAALRYVDHVAINQWPTAVPTLELVKPSLYVKGPDYKNSEEDLTGGIIEEQRAIESVGGAIGFTEAETHSSSTLLNQYFPSFSSEMEAFLSPLRREREELISGLQASDRISHYSIDWQERGALVDGEMVPYFDTLPSERPTIELNSGLPPKWVALYAVSTAYLADTSSEHPEHNRVLKFIDHLLK